MEFLTEYTGGGRDWPQSMIRFVATFVIATRAPIEHHDSSDCGDLVPAESGGS